MALTKVTGFGIGTIVDNVVMTSDDPTITMTDSSGTTDIATIVATSGALIVTARDGNSDGEIIFKGDTGSAVTEHARIASTGLMTVISEGNAVQTSVQQGLAKSWLSMNGTGTIAVRDSFNMTGITDQGVGLTTVTIANNMSSAEYSVGGVSGTFINNSDNVRLGLSTEAEAPTSTLFRTITRIANTNANADVTYSFTQVFGDLA